MFRFVLEKTLRLQSNLDVDEPFSPRMRKTPRRYEVGSGNAVFHSSLRDYFKVHYYEVIDLIVNFIQQRFDQPGYGIYRSLQDLLIKSAQGEDFSAEFDSVVQFYGSDFNSATLKAQLELLHTCFSSSSSLSPTFTDIKLSLGVQYKFVIY